MTPEEIAELQAENAALVADRDRLLALVGQAMSDQDPLKTQLGNALAEAAYYQTIAAQTAAANYRLRNSLMAANDEVRRTKETVPSTGSPATR